jgi:hypothetical protein
MGHRSSNCRPILQLAIFNQKRAQLVPLFFLPRLYTLHPTL